MLFSAAQRATLESKKLEHSIGLIGTAVGSTITRYAWPRSWRSWFSRHCQRLAVFALPKRSPERFANAAFRLSPLWRVVCSVGLILVSLLFIGGGVAQDRSAANIFVVLMLLGAAYYGVRNAMLRRQGLQIEDVLRKDRALASAD